MNKKYSFNEQFFQTLTPQSLYFLGVLATDGCISNIDGEKYEIRIESADKDLVESLKDHRGCRCVIMTNPHYVHVIICF